MGGVAGKLAVGGIGGRCRLLMFGHLYRLVCVLLLIAKKRLGNYPNLFRDSYGFWDPQHETYFIAIEGIIGEPAREHHLYALS